MLQVIEELIAKEGGLSLIKNLFADAEVLIGNLEDDLLKDKSLRNAAIDCLIAILQKQKQ